MGRLRETNIGEPPHLHRKGRTWYHVTGTIPRKWTRLSTYKSEALILYEEIEERTKKGKPPVITEVMLTADHRKMMRELQAYLGCSASEVVRIALEIAHHQEIRTPRPPTRRRPSSTSRGSPRT